MLERRRGSTGQNDANIVILYKNKSDRGDYNNYRDISLLNIVGKPFANVALIKLRVLAERIYPDADLHLSADFG